MDLLLVGGYKQDVSTVDPVWCVGYIEEMPILTDTTSFSCSYCF